MNDLYLANRRRPASRPLGQKFAPLAWCGMIYAAGDLEPRGTTGEAGPLGLMVGGCPASARQIERLSPPKVARVWSALLAGRILMYKLLKRATHHAPRVFGIRAMSLDKKDPPRTRIGSGSAAGAGWRNGGDGVLMRGNCHVFPGSPQLGAWEAGCQPKQAGSQAQRALRAGSLGPRWGHEAGRPGPFLGKTAMLRGFDPAAKGAAR